MDDTAFDQLREVISLRFLVTRARDLPENPWTYTEISSFMTMVAPDHCRERILEVCREEYAT